MNARLLFALFILSLSLTACQSSEPLAVTEETVVIAYAEPITDYSPFSYTAANRRYLANIYEPLVAYDASFNTTTALAVSWGRQNDTTWEFKLRKGVSFHDGSGFDAADVLYSFSEARAEGSELAPLLTGIESVEAVDEYKVVISTKAPDPLLLNRLVNLYMVPEGFEDPLAPNGTGAYSVAGFENNALLLKRFEGYWGETPYFAKAELWHEPDPSLRYQALKEGKVDVLSNVPPQYVEELESEGVQLFEFPSLETSFLVLNDKGIFADKELRETAWTALQGDYAEQVGGGYLRPTEQYAASGIFGYVSDWEPSEPETKILESPVSVILDLPEGIYALGQLIEKDLESAGFDVSINELPLEDFEAKIYSGESDLFFFGWKYDLADVSDFYESVVATDGSFNGASYSNPALDVLIEQASTTMDLQLRRELLQSIAELYYEDRVMVPLFEAQLLYGVAPDVEWPLRLDGMILASEITKNVLK